MSVWPTGWIRTMAGLLLAAMLLGGCETADTARDAVRVRGAKASDQTLSNAVWVVCKLTPIGAIERRYGMTLETAQTYRRFCHGDGEANVIAPQ